MAASDPSEAGPSSGTPGRESLQQRSEWREFISHSAAQFSIGPRVLFLMTKDKNEDTEKKIGQIGNPEDEESADGNWLIARGLWLDTEKLYLENRRGLRTYLSTAQFHSLVMLREWLDSEFEDPAVVQELFAAIYDAEPDEGIPHQKQDSDNHLLDASFRERTLYQKLMADLFREEFSPMHWVAEGKEQCSGFLADKRRRAWQARTAQRISSKFISASWIEGIGNSNGSCPFENPLPRVDYCPWLPRDPSRNGFPRYLWHIESKMTVDTRTLSRKVRYTCISHTWGRWRLKEWTKLPGIPWQVPLNRRFDIKDLPDAFYSRKDRFTTEYVWLDLFCIPQELGNPEYTSITNNEIGRQAAIFQNATSCIAWLNYINDWDAEYCAIAWLSVEFMKLSSQPGMTDTSRISEVARNACNLPLSLTRRSPPTFGYPKWRQKLAGLGDALDRWSRRLRKRRPYYHFEPSDWFSGVWTLQEAYLRPNMILANRDWEILCDAAGQPISLEELFAINHAVESIGSYGTQVLGSFLIEGHGIEDEPIDTLMKIHAKPGYLDTYPPGPRQLNAMIAKTHLFSDSLTSRVDPLIQANGRFSTAGRAGRAQAIMSSLGITDWYHANPVVKEADLVLGMYPIAFLREAATKIGPDFWLTSNESPSPWELLSPVSRLAGTMLPFSTKAASRYRMKSLTRRGTPPAGTPRDLHSSVATWQIRVDGSTRICEAGILASRKHLDGPGGEWKVLLGFWGDRLESCETTLSDWIRGQNSMLDTYAICLVNASISNPSNIGLILQGFKTSHTTKLVKVGYFVVHVDHLTFGEYIESETVDWVVI